MSLLIHCLHDEIKGCMKEFATTLVKSIVVRKQKNIEFLFLSLIPDYQIKDDKDLTIELLTKAYLVD